MTKGRKKRIHRPLNPCPKCGCVYALSKKPIWICVNCGRKRLMNPKGYAKGQRVHSSIACPYPDCPNPNSGWITKSGHLHGEQMYRCQICKREFSSNTKFCPYCKRQIISKQGKPLCPKCLAENPSIKNSHLRSKFMTERNKPQDRGKKHMPNRDKIQLYKCCRGHHFYI